MEPTLYLHRFKSNLADRALGHFLTKLHHKIVSLPIDFATVWYIFSRLSRTRIQFRKGVRLWRQASFQTTTPNHHYNDAR